MYYIITQYYIIGCYKSSDRKKVKTGAYVHYSSINYVMHPILTLQVMKTHGEKKQQHFMSLRGVLNS